MPFFSAEFVEVTKFTGPSGCTESLRGGMRSLMRSSPLASSKLRILCCGENPRMATRRKRKAQELSLHPGIARKPGSTHRTVMSTEHVSGESSNINSGSVLAVVTLSGAVTSILVTCKVAVSF